MTRRTMLRSLVAAMSGVVMAAAAAGNDKNLSTPQLNAQPSHALASGSKAFAQTA
jgi:hypothetical protein